MKQNYKESYEIFLRRFCGNLRKALSESGLTQRKQLLAGLDPRYIARIKKGEGNPTLMTIWRICKTTGIDPESLFKK
ncbi:MAG: helix-turn-helix transcriptional regulator [Deltaproteobacteria bacterium]|nr:helix-turn-helix transcriptional regulator [Deltaproteobacteria bacterium]